MVSADFFLQHFCMRMQHIFACKYKVCDSVLVLSSCTVVNLGSWTLNFQNHMTVTLMVGLGENPVLQIMQKVSVHYCYVHYS